MDRRMGKEGASNANTVPRLPDETWGTQQGPPPLNLSYPVSIQNLSGTKPAKLDITGTIVETRDFHKYVIKVDGSGRLTLRNRRYLRKLFLDVGLYGSNTHTKANQSLAGESVKDTSSPVESRSLVDLTPTNQQSFHNSWPLTTQQPRLCEC